MSGLDGCVNSRIRQIVIHFRRCLGIKEVMNYGTFFKYKKIYFRIRR